jgi:acyl-coenzyme A synthetase/AMP-(fatty) acid ligase
MVDHVTAILQGTSHIQTIEVPDIAQFFREDEAEAVNYSKTWEEGKDDPWLVYHTSGTTGTLPCRSF